MGEIRREDDFSRKARRLGVILLVAGLLAFYPIFFIGNSGWGSDREEEKRPLSYRGGIIIELQGNSWPVSLEGRPLRGFDGASMAEYKFRTVREGEDFHYLIAGLTQPSYDLELSFIEYAHTFPGLRVFTVSCNGASLPGMRSVDLCARARKELAYQVTIPAVEAPGGIMDLRFKAEKGLALVSHIRLSAPGVKDLEIDTGESRHWTHFPLRFSPSQEQDVFEVILSRFGSRFMVNPAPQLLAWRQTPLGTWTDDLSELVLAFRDEEGDIRCLPFTDRYPVFSGIDQDLSLTGVTYVCRDPSLPFTAKVTIRAPFYPGDVKLSTAPFFYLDISLSNPGETPVRGELLLARAHKDDNTGNKSPRDLKGSRGYKFTTRYTYGQENHVNLENNSRFFEFWEAVAVGEPDRVNWHYRDIADTGWMWSSPEGYPQARSYPVYTFVPRGYSGFDAEFDLEPLASDGLNAVLACHSADNVLEVQEDEGFRFLYNQPSGPNLTSVDAVVDYALAERDSILEKSGFFDTVLSEQYLSPFPQAGRDLAAVALQNFICNAWWCYNSSGQSGSACGRAPPACSIPPSTWSITTPGSTSPSGPTC
ncbi:MAG: hypothetical protein HPY75_09545 [Actinobacteria bacterium]|nr:hypothetical protein [Actinomycetota bacterium]